MLKKRNGLISEVEARYYLVQMVHGLQYLKQKKIIHREYPFCLKLVLSLETTF